MQGLKLRRAAIAFVAGAITVTSAWAGASLAPTGGNTPQAATAAKSTVVAEPGSLGAGEVLAGAAKTSLEPRPEDYGGTWEKDPAKCKKLSESEFQNILDDPAQEGDHLANTGSTWPENPNCIYMGGFSIGPMNPVSSWDQDYGIWVRAIAIRDRQGDDLVMAVIDAEGWFWDYAKKCADCGIKQITADLAAEAGLGLEPENIIIAATHSHAAPEFIGGWGFVPDWYMKQATDTIKSTIRDAIANQEPALLEYGEQLARGFNGERRSTYRSAEEQNLAWLRAYVPGDTSTKTKKDDAPRTIATLGAYAAHPTSKGTNGGEAHPDWPGLFEKQLERRFGGIGLHFMTGLGNMSNSGLGNEHEGTPTRADDLAALIARTGDGRAVTQPDVKSARTTWVHPTTNVPLTALGLPGFFDRKFVEGPAQVRTGKSPDTAPCASAAPVGAEVPVSAARIGPDIAISAAPGEIFSNVSNTLKEQSGANVTFPLGQANDALGYMPQSFELHPVGQQGLGFAVAGAVFVNYEDSYSIDRCFGDAALENTIDLWSTPELSPASTLRRKRR